MMLAGGDKDLEIILGDGSTFRGTVDNTEDLLKNTQLFSGKGRNKPQNGDTNGCLIYFSASFARK